MTHFVKLLVAAMSALELPRQVGELGQALRTRFEVAQLNFAMDELVTDDHRKMCAFARRPLELPRQRPLRQIR